MGPIKSSGQMHRKHKRKQNKIKRIKGSRYENKKQCSAFYFWGKI